MGLWRGALLRHFGRHPASSDHAMGVCPMLAAPERLGAACSGPQGEGTFTGLRRLIVRGAPLIR